MREIKFRAWDKNNKYEIGTDGSVYSNDYNHTGNRKELHQYLDKDGYPYVFFTINGVRYKRIVHRLVAKLFIDKIIGKDQVNHKNGIRHDNRVENLEWVTPRENTIHGYRVNGRKQSAKQILSASMRFSGEKNPKSKINYQQAEKIRSLRKNGLKLKQIADIFSISMAQTSAIAHGRFWKCNN